jgi:hypothetical protein
MGRGTFCEGLRRADGEDLRGGEVCRKKGVDRASYNKFIEVVEVVEIVEIVEVH